MSDIPVAFSLLLTSPKPSFLQFPVIIIFILKLLCLNYCVISVY